MLMLTNMKPNVDAEPIKASFFTQNYKEQVTWRDAATGRLLAESDFFDPMPGNGLIVPTFGGRFYYPTAAGKGFFVLQPMPKRAAAAQ